ncbi:FkbM family methyltransferase [Bizionia hallyeonensis]|uniref:FkbM family methyltransferase n=1 Tax=Bizionia hallyeonensis TaxID=1123757 RepID=A0ABW0C6X0_9FLAO
MSLKKRAVKLLARTYFQPFYKKLHYLALKGMNYGSANSPSDSGEISVLKILQKELPMNPVVFDVGANNGQYLDFILNYFRELNPNIHVFEPDAVAFRTLEKRFSNKPNIHLNNLALGHTQKTGTLYSSGIGGVDGSLVDTEEKDLKKTTISVITLDDYCKQHTIEKIHFIKIDVEGFEMNVLKGAKVALEKQHIERIQIEHGSLQSIIAGTTLYSFIKLLKTYQCYHIKQNGIYKINYAPIEEIYYNSNYYFKFKE